MADQDEQTYAQWLKVNAGPNFAALIARHGSYEAIPPQAWTAFADAQLEWERRRRARAAEDGPFSCAPIETKLQGLAGERIPFLVY
jgi:hypothetical protein